MLEIVPFRAQKAKTRLLYLGSCTIMMNLGEGTANLTATITTTTTTITTATTNTNTNSNNNTII
jgi:hypothetical protein